ncbi:MAG: hypothetical protein ICV68_04250 [Pyrinomonadaceae bacterium]|nr:hypothetical protein [Pyrinomonadaceae bacterium]
MTLDITDQERELLVELLAAKNTAMLHELHHTDARDYRESVKRSIEVLEGLRAKVEALPADVAA